MRRWWSYLKYVLRHKWFVLVAGRRIGAPVRRLILHDMSKFLPSEWWPYARTFYKEDGGKQYKEDDGFNQAWLLHQHRNPHHWQYWLLKTDRGDLVAVEMPKAYAIEMVADWMGAGRAITGKWEAKEWYEKNRSKIALGPKTREFVDRLLR